VQATLAAQFERPVRDRLDAFTLMRGWKDKFR
jgi:hydroxyacylglutathione hydrolase